MQAFFKYGKKSVFMILRIYFLLIIALFFSQNMLLFHKVPLNTEVIAQVQQQYPHIESVSLPTKDGEMLSGYFLRREATSKILVYFGGNAEEVSDFFISANEFPNFSLLSFNYRGYGASTGNPNQKVLFADALSIYDFVTTQYHPSEVVVMGRSLGSGVAAYVSANRKVDNLILVTPYDSIEHVAQNKYPIFPISLLLRSPFKLSDFVSDIQAPTLFLIAEKDTVIPPFHAEILYDEFLGKKQKVVVPNMGHNSISNSQQYWESIHAFLKQ